MWAHINITDITPSFLKASAYTEHVAHWEKIAEIIDLSSLSLLEYGCGYSTKWFLDNFKDVVSCEIVHAGYSPAWLFKCEKLYGNYTNWSPILTDLLAPDSLTSERKRVFPQLGLSEERPTEKYATIPNIYNGPHSEESGGLDYFNHSSDAIQSFMKDRFSSKSFNMAFIDHGAAPLRGPCVQACINEGIDIIMCHDMGHKNFDTNHMVPVNKEYNYHHLRHNPKTYQFFRTLKGMGSGFWVRKVPQYESLLKKLENY